MEPRQDQRTRLEAARSHLPAAAHAAVEQLVGAALAVRDRWSEGRRARQAALDVDARSRGLAPPGERFARWSARYWDPMAGQVRHADCTDRTLAAPVIRVVDHPSAVDRWTRAHFRPGWTLYPRWVGFLPSLRLRRMARWALRGREPWCRLEDVSTAHGFASMVQRMGSDTAAR